MRLSLDVVGDRELEAKFRIAHSGLRAEVDAEVVAQAKAIRDFIVQQLLSGQMLRIRDKKDKGIRNDMRFVVRRGEGGVLADIHPKPNSPLWILGSGFARKRILVTKPATRKQKRNARATTRRWRRLLRKYLGTYEREHAIKKVPFMEMAYYQYKDVSTEALKRAVLRGAASIQQSFDDTGGI